LGSSCWRLWQPALPRRPTAPPGLSLVHTSWSLRPLSPPRGLRLRVRIRRHVLDREIASGRLAETDPGLALRAKQLTSAHERGCVATALAHILAAAEERKADPVSPLKLNHAEVLAARYDIVVLIEKLRSDRPASARGVALARLLVDAHDSPLLRPHPSQTVGQAVVTATAALHLDG
jgi:hypothetical protein